jgi:hypothetical protein
MKLKRDQIFKLLAEFDDMSVGELELEVIVDYRAPEHLDIDEETVELSTVILEISCQELLQDGVEPEYAITLQEFLDAEVVGDGTILRIGTTRSPKMSNDMVVPVSIDVQFSTIKSIDLVKICEA